MAKRRSRTKETINERIHLADIAGYREEKEEAAKLIDILQNFALYKARGASVPKGLLLCGEPGVGKTMFAKAISTEAGVPLYEFDADESENEEETIKALKSLFKKAKETVPAIIFIDELDELVSTSDAGGRGFQSDYSRKVLKTLLTEIDGISSSDGVLVIATTNRKRAVPPALIRSGRLEKQITFRVPNAEDRLAIAAMYLNKARITAVPPAALARKTDGFTGADIKSLVNAAVIESVRKKEEVSLKTIVSVIPTIRFGEIKKANRGGPSDAVCYHEIGHFLAQYELDGRIASISVERFGGVGGFISIEEELGNLLGKREESDRPAREILESVVVFLGGIAGEEVFLGERYCGGASDIAGAVGAIHRVMSNGCLGFDLLPSFDMGRAGPNAGVIVSIPNDAAPGKRSEKYIEILNEKLAKAIESVRKWEGLGRIIFPILKEKESLTSEELSAIIDDYRKEHPDEIRA